MLKSFPAHFQFSFLATAILCLTVSFARADAPGLKIVKMPADIQHQTFDPKHPPADLPTLTPPENAVCASDFLSDANVGVTAEMTDANHATATVNSITVTLQLNITIWLPTKPPQTVVDHEEGHRQISEYYYKTAEAIAQRVAAPYIGKKIIITGPDFQGNLRKAADDVGTKITDEYNKEMAVEPTQALYDKITDHSRNDLPIAKDAAAMAIKQMSGPSTQPTTNPTN